MCVSLVPFWTFLPLATSEGWPGSMQTTVRSAVETDFEGGADFELFLTCDAGVQSCSERRRARRAVYFIPVCGDEALFTKVI
jgi:hypothetical protein